MRFKELASKIGKARLSTRAISEIVHNTTRTFRNFVPAFSVAEYSPQLIGEVTKNRFVDAALRIGNSPQYDSYKDAKAPYGYLYGRHIIAESNPLNGGVYIGVIAHEAVVVDEKYGLLPDIYNELIMRFARDNGRRSQMEENIFTQIISLCKEQLPFNERAIRKLAHQKGIGPDRKTALDFYIKQRTGAARHQVLLGSYLLQKLQMKGLIGGLAKIDHDYAGLPGEDEKLIYSTSSGKKLIFDPCA